MNKGIIFTALSALLYGSIGIFGMRLLDKGLSVSDMLFWRFLCSCLLLIPMVFIFSRSIFKLKNKKSLVILFLVGGIFQGLSTVFYFESSKFIGTGLAMVLFFTYPIFVTALALFIKKIPIQRNIFLALLLIIIGCTLISNIYATSNFDFRGLLLALLSGFAYGFYVFFSKELSKNISPLLSTLCVCLGTISALALYIFITPPALNWPQTQETWLLIWLFALIGTVLPVLFLLVGMNYLSATKASIISVLEPVAVLVVGALLLDEPLAPIQIIGAFIILASTILIYINPSKSLAET